MSNVIDLPNNTNKEDDELAEAAYENYEETKTEFDSHTLEMIKRGIKSGLSMLDKAIETDETMAIPNIQKTLINLNDLVAMLEHDLVGMIKNIEAQAAAQWTTQAHLQTLIETLKANSALTDQELEQTWNKIIPPMMEEMQSQTQS